MFGQWDLLVKCIDKERDYVQKWNFDVQNKYFFHHVATDLLMVTLV